MMSILEPERLSNFLLRMLQFGTQVQLMPDAVAGGHDCFSGRVGKSFKGGFRDDRAMTFIELPGKSVENIGVEVEIFIWIRVVVGRKHDVPARICFSPDSGQSLQNIPPDAIQQARGKKARRCGLNRQPCHMVGSVAGTGQVFLNLFPGPGRIAGRFKQNFFYRLGLIVVFVSHRQAD